MLLRKFRKSIIKNKIDKQLLINESNKKDVSSKINSVLILVDKNVTNDLIQDIVEKVAVDVSKRNVLFFREDFKEELLYKYSFSKKDFTLLGNIKSVNVQNLVKKEFGLLVNYVESNVYVDCIVALSKAYFKVGFSSEKQELYDLMIAVERGNVDLFNRELEKYLNILNKI